MCCSARDQGTGQALATTTEFVTAWKAVAAGPTVAAVQIGARQWLSAAGSAVGASPSVPASAIGAGRHTRGRRLARASPALSNV